MQAEEPDSNPCKDWVALLQGGLPDFPSDSDGRQHFLDFTLDFLFFSDLQKMLLT